MGLIILEDKDGNRRTIQSGKQIRPPRQPGERIVGVEKNSTKFSKRNQLRVEQYNRFILLGNLFGMGLAEFITFCAKVFGIKPCSSCEMRRLILHRIGELGIKKALWMIFKTFKAQSTKNIGFSLTKKILIAGRDLIGGKSNGVSAS